MSFSLVGVLFIAVCTVSFFGLLKNLKKLFNWFFSLTVISTVFLDMGYVCKIGGFVVEYNYLFTVMTFISALLYIYHYRIHTKIFEYFAALTVIVLLNLIFKGLINAEYLSCDFDTVWDTLFSEGALHSVTVSAGALQTVVRFIIFGILVFAFTSSGNRSVIDYICKKVYAVSVVYLIYLIVEFVLLNVFGLNTLRTVSFGLFGQTEFEFIEPRSFMGILAPMGIAREPSNLGLSILYIGVFNLYHFRRVGRGKWTVLLYSLIALISGSLSGYLHLCTVFYVFYCSAHRETKKSILICAPIILIGFAVLFFSAYRTRILELLENIGNFDKGIAELPVSSEIIRLYSIYNNLSYFLRYPLFGTGMGTIYSFSPLITLLANLGAVGAVLFYKFYCTSIRTVLKRKEIKVYELIPVLLLSFTFTGHLGYILYFERTFILFIVVVLLCNSKKGRIVNE